MLLLTSVAFAMTTVASAPASTAHTAAVVVTKRVTKPGVYRVTIRLSSRAKRAAHVRLLVGAVLRDAVTAGDRRLTTVSLEIPIAGHTLTVVATSPRPRPRMAISLLYRGSLIPVPPVEKAVRYLAEQGGSVLPAGRRAVVGSPARVREGIEEVAREYGAGEVMIVTITYDHAARRRSYELIAREFGLPRG